MRRRITSAYILISVLAVSAMTVLACGGDGDTAEGAGPAPTSQAAPLASATPQAPAAAPTSAPLATPAPEEDGAPATVSMADYSFTPAAFNARVGEQVRLTVTNNGDLPHTFTIANLVDTGILDAGESRTITFTPRSAGILTFFCAVHGPALMSGQVTVAP